MDAKKEEIIRFTATFISGFGVGAVVGAAGKIIGAVVPPQMRIPYTIGIFAISAYIGDKVGDYTADYVVDMIDDLDAVFTTLQKKREALA